jgi:hypothetical protein
VRRSGLSRHLLEIPMRRILMLAACLCLAAPVSAADSERDAVVKVVTEAYINGVHAAPSTAAMRAGFHPDFRMLVLTDGKMSAVTLDEWIGRMEKAAAANPNAVRPKVTSEIPVVDITGNAAGVRVELWRNGRHTFSDHLLLYKFADGWKIVSKAFYTHP